MRLALLSDIHGNPLALDAVLQDIASQGGVDAYWVLGDVAAIGYDPIGAIERLALVSVVLLARVNASRYTVTAKHPHPHAAQVQKVLRLLLLFVEIATSFACTGGAGGASGNRETAGAIPIEMT